MARLECIGGPMDGRAYNSQSVSASKFAFVCRKGDVGIRDALYRVVLVFDGYSDDPKPEGEFFLVVGDEGQNS